MKVKKLNFSMRNKARLCYAEFGRRVLSELFCYVIYVCCGCSGMISVFDSGDLSGNRP